jgi:hypothetical protein
MTDEQFNIIISKLAELDAKIDKLSPSSQTKITVLGNSTVKKSVKGLGLDTDFSLPPTNSHME